VRQAVEAAVGPAEAHRGCSPRAGYRLPARRMLLRGANASPTAKTFERKAQWAIVRDHLSVFSLFRTILTKKKRLTIIQCMQPNRCFLLLSSHLTRNPILTRLKNNRCRCVRFNTILKHFSGQQFVAVVLAEVVEVKIKTEAEDEDEDDLKQLDSSTWKCSICSRTFQTKWKAEDHVAAHRALPGGVTCLMCGRTYQDRLFFAVHMSNKHKKPLS
jgi:hypothetical protein